MKDLLAEKEKLKHIVDDHENNRTISVQDYRRLDVKVGTQARQKEQLITFIERVKLPGIREIIEAMREGFRLEEEFRFEASVLSHMEIEMEEIGELGGMLSK